MSAPICSAQVAWPAAGAGLPVCLEATQHARWSHSTLFPVPLCPQAIAEHHNVCSQLHMPAQSGSTSTLARMRRGYSREAYDALVEHVQACIPGVALSTDIIAGAADLHRSQAV